MPGGLQRSHRDCVVQQSAPEGCPTTSPTCAAPTTAAMEPGTRAQRGAKARDRAASLDVAAALLQLPEAAARGRPASPLGEPAVKRLRADAVQPQSDASEAASLIQLLTQTAAAPTPQQQGLDLPSMLLALAATSSGEQQLPPRARASHAAVPDHSTAGQGGFRGTGAGLAASRPLIWPVVTSRAPQPEPSLPTIQPDAPPTPQEQLRCLLQALPALQQAQHQAPTSPVTPGAAQQGVWAAESPRKAPAPREAASLAAMLAALTQPQLQRSAASSPSLHRQAAHTQAGRRDADGATAAAGAAPPEAPGPPQPPRPGTRQHSPFEHAGELHDFTGSCQCLSA